MRLARHDYRAPSASKTSACAACISQQSHSKGLRRTAAVERIRITSLGCRARGGMHAAPAPRLRISEAQKAARGIKTPTQGKMLEEQINGEAPNGRDD